MLKSSQLAIQWIMIIGALLLTGCVGGSAGNNPPQTGSLSSLNQDSGVARPLVEGPVSGGLGIPQAITTVFPLSLVGYRQSEYFLSGMAAGYEPVEAMSSDGKWNVRVATQAAYKTRIIVYRPIDAAKFNGTVVVEWLNDSLGFNVAADWVTAHNELIREGYAWVGVSAQAVGIEGGVSLSGDNLPLKKIDPTRYGSLHHPGDTFSYDIFSQVAQSLRDPQGADPLDGLKARKLIAAGVSQGAFRLTTYVNAIAPLNHLFDGFFIHGRAHGSAALSELPQADIPTPATVYVRNDSPPVMVVLTESDPFLYGSYQPDHQEDGTSYRLWEIAGAAHVDAYTIYGTVDTGISSKYANVISVSNPLPGFIQCPKPINAGPQHFVVNAAIHSLQRWITAGILPPSAPRLTVTGNPATYALDVHGNVLGGIRTPYVDVPIAKLSGNGQDGSLKELSGSCFIFGTTTLFDSATLKRLYPTHASYVAAVNAATDSAVAQGFLREIDGNMIKQAAQESTIGN